MHQLIEYAEHLIVEFWYVPIIYALVMVLVFGYYSAKYGTDGPDGLIPIFGSIFWPIVLAFHIVLFPVKILYDLGRACQGK